MGPKTGLVVFKKGTKSWPCWDLKPRSSSPLPSHHADQLRYGNSSDVLNAYKKNFGHKFVGQGSGDVKCILTIYMLGNKLNNSCSLSLTLYAGECK